MFGDSYTQMGFSTFASKIGMVVPLGVVAALAWAREGVDIRMLYRMSLVLMAWGVVPTVLLDVFPVASRVLMSAAQAGNMVVACVIACTSAHRRHESAMFGCGVLMTISLMATILGNATGVVFTQLCFELSEPMARLAGTAIVLMVVVLAAYVMHDQDLSSLVTDRPSGATTPSDAPVPAAAVRDAGLGQACACLREALLVGTSADRMKGCAQVAEAAGLSKREAAVFALMVDGRNVAVIGEELFIAQGTVRAHMSRIYEKLGVHSREELRRLFGGRGEAQAGLFEGKQW